MRYLALIYWLLYSASIIYIGVVVKYAESTVNGIEIEVLPVGIDNVVLLLSKICPRASVVIVEYVFSTMSELVFIPAFGTSVILVSLFISPKIANPAGCSISLTESNQSFTGMEVLITYLRLKT